MKATKQVTKIKSKTSETLKINEELTWKNIPLRWLTKVE